MEPRQGKSSPLVIWPLIAFVLLALYVLSLGPATYWISEHGAHHLTILRLVIVFYKPLEYVHGICKPFDDLLDWYVHLWHE
jgi:hypothetical protein